MKKRTKPLPRTLEAARAELDQLDRRMREDARRFDALIECIGALHSQHKLPAPGSRWRRSTDIGLPGGKLHTSEYVFRIYTHVDYSDRATPRAGPLLVFEGESDDGTLHYSAVALSTFYREFDPLPTAKRKARAS